MIPAVNWSRDLESDDVRYTNGSVLAFDGILPRYSADPTSQARVDQLRRASAEALDEFVHLTSLRRPLRSVYENRSSDGEADPTGADVPYVLNQSDALLDAVAEWYDRHLGTRIEIEAEAAAFRLMAARADGTTHNLVRVGQGIQQVLPVVTHLCAIRLGLGTRFIVIEEPELNLHPAAHPELADLVLEARRADSRAQVLVETHSENFVLRLRYHVAAGQLDPDEVNLLWFQDDGGATTVEEIRINADGSVSDWPSGVFSEDLAEARSIARVSRP